MTEQEVHRFAANRLTHYEGQAIVGGRVVWSAEWVSVKIELADGSRVVGSARPYLHLPEPDLNITFSDIVGEVVEATKP